MQLADIVQKITSPTNTWTTEKLTAKCKKIALTLYAYNRIKVIHKKITDENKKVVVKTKFSLIEDSRLITTCSSPYCDAWLSSLYSCSVSQFWKLTLQKSLIVNKVNIILDYYNLLCGLLRERARWTESCAVIGYRSGQDGTARCIPQEKFPWKPCNKILYWQSLFA